MTSVNSARRAFLRGDIHARSYRVRMPWMADDFTDLCTRCDDCINACQEHVLIRGDGGYPSISFQLGGCTLCGDCARACRQDALQDTAGPAWNQHAHIGEQCLDSRGVTCRACGDACDERAIRFQLQVGGIATPTLDKDLCNGCGSCIAVCPIHIIQIQEAA